MVALYKINLKKAELAAVIKAKKWYEGDKPVLSRRAFFRERDRLVSMGLIAVEMHKALDHTLVKPRFVNKLWIRPTAELSRIVFEPGYWETVREKYEYQPVKKKPRGVHVAKAKVQLELQAA